MRKTIEHAAIVGQGPGVEETHRAVGEIDEGVRLETGADAFCVVEHSGIDPSHERLAVSGRSVTEMVITAAGLSLANGLDPVSVCVLDPGGQRGRVMMTFGDPYSVAALWAARGGRRMAKVVAESALHAAHGIMAARARQRDHPVTEH